MAAKITPSFGLFPKSIKAIDANIPGYLLLYILPFVVISYGVLSSQTAEGLLGSPFVLIGGLLNLFAFAPLYYLNTQAAKGKTLSVAQTLQGFRFFWRLLGLSILTSLIIILGFIAFIVPGIIMLRRYLLAPYFLIDQDLGIRQAMALSAERSKKYSGAIYGIVGVMFVLSLPGIVPLYGTIVSYILQFLYIAAPAARYFEIKTGKADSTNAAWSAS